jgi:hypothetical protein
LEFHQRSTELLTLLHVSQDVIQSARRLRKCHGGIAAALEIEGFHQFLEAPAGTTMFSKGRRTSSK